MIGDVVNAAKALIDTAGTLHGLGKERRANLASYFDKISEVLLRFVNMTRHGEKSQGPCSELAVYAEKIHSVASRTLHKDEVEQLAKVLANACQNWQLSTPNLDEIEKAAGTFKGYAGTLRAM